MVGKKLASVVLDYSGVDSRQMVAVS